MEEKQFSDYKRWLDDCWFSTLIPLGYPVTPTDYRVDGEDNSVEVAAQCSVEQFLPELLKSPKITIII